MFVPALGSPHRRVFSQETGEHRTGLAPPPSHAPRPQVGSSKGVSPTSIAVATAACGQVAKAAHARRGRRPWSRGRGWSDAGSDGDGVWRGLRTLCRPKLLIARRHFDRFPPLVWSLASGRGYISERIALQMRTVPPKSLPRGGARLGSGRPLLLAESGKRRPLGFYLFLEFHPCPCGSSPQKSSFVVFKCLTE